MKPDVLLLSILRAPALAPALDLAGWDLLLRQAVAANLSATLVYLFEQAGVLAQVPEQPRRHLEWARTLAERHSRGVAYEVRQLQLAVAPTGAQMILLKGAAYAMAGMPWAKGRLFSDVDILVPFGQLDAVEHALLKNGWATTHEDLYDQRYYREWMHELPPMRHVRSQGMVDVHHAILPRTAAAGADGATPDPAKLRAAAVALGDSGLFVLAPADMVLHSALHLFHDSEFDKGLRDLLDIHRLLLQFGAEAGFWDRLCMRARELGLGRPLYYALRYSTRMLGTPVPAAVIARVDAWAPSAPLRWLMDGLFGAALLPCHASCARPWDKAARFALFIRANWLRMPPLMLARHLLRKALVPPQGQAAERVLP